MSIHLDQIDELRKRANVSYGEAKHALELYKGDMLEALVYLENQNKMKPEKNNCLLLKFKNLIKKGNNTRFIIKKKDKILIDLTTTLAVIITILVPHITILSLIIAVFTGHRITFVDKDGKGMKVNETLNKISDTVSLAKEKLTEDDDIGTYTTK